MSYIWPGASTLQPPPGNKRCRIGINGAQSHQADILKVQPAKPKGDPFISMSLAWLSLHCKFEMSFLLPSLPLAVSLSRERKHFPP